MKKVLAAITLLFILPFALAYLFYHHQQWLPHHKVNHGTLITPTQKIAVFALKPTATDHHWLLIHIHRGDCDLSCQKRLYNMHQIQLALGKDQNRLANVLLTPADQLLEDRLQQWVSTNGIRRWQTRAELLGHAQAWYIVDPLGNLVLSYPADVNPEFILDDLKYLMNISSIG